MNKKKSFIGILQKNEQLSLSFSKQVFLVLRKRIVKQKRKRISLKSKRRDF